jgi:hypothetical protein
VRVSATLSTPNDIIRRGRATRLEGGGRAERSVMCGCQSCVPLFPNPAPATMMPRRPRTILDDICEKKSRISSASTKALRKYRRWQDCPPAKGIYMHIVQWNKDKAYYILRTSRDDELGDLIPPLPFPPSPVSHVSRRPRPSQLPLYSFFKSTTFCS